MDNSEFSTDRGPREAKINEEASTIFHKVSMNGELIDEQTRREHFDRSGIAGYLRSGDVSRVLSPKCELTKFLRNTFLWLQGPQTYLILVSPPGRGKSVAAGWALVEHGGCYARARRCERLFAASFGEEAKEQERLLGARLLVVDDLGTESKEGALRLAMSEIIDGRQNRTKTIFVANMNKEQFVERYLGPRELSRFTGTALFIGDDGDDMRKGG